MRAPQIIIGIAGRLRQWLGASPQEVAKHHARAHPAYPTSERDWDWPSIKAGLERAGSSLTDIAAEHGVTKAAVCKVKTRPSARLEEAIAAHLGVPPQLIWPSRYAPDGTRRRVGRHCRRHG